MMMSAEALAEVAKKERALGYECGYADAWKEMRKIVSANHEYVVSVQEAFAPKQREAYELQVKCVRQQEVIEQLRSQLKTQEEISVAVRLFADGEHAKDQEKINELRQALLQHVKETSNDF